METSKPKQPLMSHSDMIFMSDLALRIGFRFHPYKDGTYGISDPNDCMLPGVVGSDLQALTRVAQILMQARAAIPALELLLAATVADLKVAQDEEDELLNDPEFTTKAYRLPDYVVRGPLPYEWSGNKGNPPISTT